MPWSYTEPPDEDGPPEEELADAYPQEYPPINPIYFNQGATMPIADNGTPPPEPIRWEGLMQNAAPVDPRSGVRFRVDIRNLTWVPPSATPNDFPIDRCACKECMTHWLVTECSVSIGTSSYESWRQMHSAISAAYVNENVASMLPSGARRPRMMTSHHESIVQMHRMRLRRFNQHFEAPPEPPEVRGAMLAQRRLQGENPQYPEVLLKDKHRALLPDPLRWILRKGGRVWSAEVECNGWDYAGVSNLLGMQTGNYSTRPDAPTILASSDATVDAEIKISCMRDGSLAHQEMARGAYDGLRSIGNACATNAGHHVHVDATRLADLGRDFVLSTVVLATRAGFVCHEALDVLAASGYDRHRFVRRQPEHVKKSPVDGWKTMPSDLGMRSNFHADRLVIAANDQTGRNATVEYRLPNGTLEPIRAHAHIAIAMALLDFAERAADGDPQAKELAASINDRAIHGAPFDEETAARFLIDSLHLSQSSYEALAIASFSAPASDEHRRLWRNATKFTAKQLSK